MRSLSSLLVLVCTMILLACSASPVVIKNNELANVFEQYKSITSESNAKQSSFFTSKMWGTVQEFRANPENKTNTSIASINNFPNEISVDQTLESIEGDTGCLIVQGTNSSDQLMDYSVVFEKQGQRWLISDVTTTVYDPNQKRWLTEPVCDIEHVQQLWLRHQQIQVEQQ